MSVQDQDPSATPVSWSN